MGGGELVEGAEFETEAVKRGRAFDFGIVRVAEHDDRGLRFAQWFLGLHPLGHENGFVIGCLLVHAR